MNLHKNAETILRRHNHGPLDGPGHGVRDVERMMLEDAATIRCACGVTIEVSGRAMASVACCTCEPHHPNDGNTARMCGPCWDAIAALARYGDPPCEIRGCELRAGHEGRCKICIGGVVSVVPPPTVPPMGARSIQLAARKPFGLQSGVALEDEARHEQLRKWADSELDRIQREAAMAYEAGKKDGKLEMMNELTSSRVFVRPGVKAPPDAGVGRIIEYSGPPPRAYQGPPLTASEAVYGFAAWLTTRYDRVTLSRYDNAGPIADLVALFCKENDLAEPRERWADHLRHPCEPDVVPAADPVTVAKFDAIIKEVFPGPEAPEGEVRLRDGGPSAAAQAKEHRGGVQVYCQNEEDIP